MSEGVTKIVRVHSLFDPSLFPKKFEKVPHVDCLNGLSKILFGDSAEDRRVSLTVNPKFLSLEHPKVEIHLRLRVQTNHSHLVPYPSHPIGKFLQRGVCKPHTLLYCDIFGFLRYPKASSNFYCLRINEVIPRDQSLLPP